MINLFVIFAGLLACCVPMSMLSKDNSTEEVKIEEVKKNEAYYCRKFCESVGGVSEFTLPDRSRADCINDKYAYECDWAKKWAECLGQSSYYGIVKNKKPVCVLIIKEGDHKFVDRARTVGKKYNILINIIVREK